MSNIYPNNAKISMTLSVPKRLLDDMEDAFFKDGNCLSIQEFYRYTFRIFNEVLLEKATEVAGKVSSPKKIVECLSSDGDRITDVMFARYGKDVYDYFSKTHSVMESPVNINLTITARLYEDIIYLRTLFGINNMKEYSAIAMMWIVSFYDERSYENTKDDILSDRRLKRANGTLLQREV